MPDLPPRVNRTAQPNSGHRTFPELIRHGILNLGRQRISVTAKLPGETRWTEQGQNMARPSFIELPTTDISAAKTFYSHAFGWVLTDFGPSYACTMTGDVDVGLQANTVEATQAPLTVIAVEDVEAALLAVTKAGGVITKAVFAYPGGRRFHFRDPSGNELAAYQAA